MWPASGPSVGFPLSTQFDHVVAQLRAERDSAQARAQAVADYTERGFTILADEDRWGWKLDRVPLRHLERDGQDGEPEAVDETVITDPQHWAVRLDEYTEYVDSQGDAVDEGDIDWDTEGPTNATSCRLCANAMPHGRPSRGG